MNSICRIGSPSSPCRAREECISITCNTRFVYVLLVVRASFMGTSIVSGLYNLRQQLDKGKTRMKVDES